MQAEPQHGLTNSLFAVWSFYDALPIADARFIGLLKRT